MREILQQTREADVAFFFKQWGGRYSKAGGRILDGRTWDEMPDAWNQHKIKSPKKSSRQQKLIELKPEYLITAK